MLGKPGILAAPPEELFSTPMPEAVGGMRSEIYSEDEGAGKKLLIVVSLFVSMMLSYMCLVYQL